MPYADHVKQKLIEQLDAIDVDIIDNSWQHAGHAGMNGIAHTDGTHLAIRVVSERFTGLGVMDQHRLVHQTLKEEMATRIHALELKTFTPERWQHLAHQ